VTLDEALTKRIKDTIRAEESPRHVPKRIIQVGELPAHAQRQVDGDRGDPTRERPSGAEPDGRRQPRLPRRDRSRRRPR
jgi:hypothetical protein